jgi:two-component system, NtrC family, response regulator HydG
LGTPLVDVGQMTQLFAPFDPVAQCLLAGRMDIQAKDEMKEAVRIVIIDDNPGSLELLSSALARPGVAVHTALTPMGGLELMRKLHPQLVITDLVMPELSGLEVLQQVVEFDPSIDVLLMTAHYTTETAVAAIRNGAADYLQKPVKIVLLRERVARLLASAEQRRKVHSATLDDSDSNFEGMIARSSQIWHLFGMLQRVAPHYRSVLVQGETGTGKDLIARALHHLSDVTGQFIVVNCSAVVETLFESELFGHVKGAFTGADRDKTGLLELANGGTIFLDEIGDMPLSTQAKLLRALQNQEFLPVGSLKLRKVNVRIVAATHRDLRAATAEGKFREDLYYRLSMVELLVPPLRERPEDISLLARHFAQKFGREFGKPITGLTPRALLVLERHSWPGNVRELEHVIGRSCMLTDNALLDVADLPAGLTQQNGPEPGEMKTPASPLADQEKRMVEEALREAGGNQSEAARKLGIGRDALRYKIKRHNL